MQVRKLIYFFLLGLISCDNNPPPETTAERGLTSSLQYSSAQSSLMVGGDLQADSPTVIQVQMNDGGHMYYLFGSNGAWARSKDLINWEILTKHEDINQNGILDPNDQTLGFSAFKAAPPNNRVNPYDSSGFYFQLSRQAGRGILWANDANNDGVVDSAPINKESKIKEIETIGFWSPSLIQLSNGDYYFYYSHCNLPGQAICNDNHAYIGAAKSPNIEGPFENIAVFMQSDGQIGDGLADLNSGYDGQPWLAQHHPSALFPDIFLDKYNAPWLVYGAGAGGIWVKKIDSSTGLPADWQQKDRTYGARIAGGNLAAIDNPSIWYSAKTDYYYLFLTYLGSDNRDAAAFNIRVARAKSPDGPYLDAAGNDLSTMHNAIETNGEKLFFDITNTSNFGVKILSGHRWQLNEDRLARSGYWSPSNPSVFSDKISGKNFLLFNTAISETSASDHVRMHEIYFTASDWPVIAPLPYTPVNKTTTLKKNDILGDYQLVFHGDDNNVTPHDSIFIFLAENGTITGDLKGSFHLEGNEITLELEELGIFSAIISWQTNPQLSSQQTLTFTGIEENGLSSIWAIQLSEKSNDEKFESIHANLLKLIPTITTHLPELPNQAEYGAKIVWSTNETDLIDLSSGQISRPALGMKNANATLKAKITLPNTSTDILEIPIQIPSSIKNHLIAQYSFEENLNENHNSLPAGTPTGKYLNLPNQSDIRYAEGHAGKALLLDGSYGINLGNGLIPYEAFTLSYWMKPTSIKINQPSMFIARNISHNDYDAGSFFGIYNQINDWAKTVTIWNRNGSDSNWPFLASNHSAELGVWQHVAVSCDSGRCAIFINGVLSGEAKLGILTGEKVTLAIGVNLWDDGFIGLIDELKIYDEALSAAEIHAWDYANISEAQWIEIAKQDIIKNLESQDIHALKSNLQLPQRGLFQSKIRWTSRNPTNIDNQGKIRRPKQGASPIKVYLNAIISLGSKTDNVTIPIKIMPENIPKPLVSYSFENNLYDSELNHSSNKVMGAQLTDQTSNSTSQYKKGIKGNGLYLDGNYGVILAEHFIIGNEYTISVWLKPERLTLHTAAVFWYANMDQWFSIVPYDLNQKLNMWMMKNGSYTDHVLDTTLQANKWVHLIISVNPKKMTLYINGKYVNTYETTPEFLVNKPTNLSVGINFWDKPFQGLIDELVIYPEALSDAEVSNLYTNQ